MNGERRTNDSVERAARMSIWGGAALERCGNRIIVGAALAAEATLSTRRLLPHRTRTITLAAILLAWFIPTFTFPAAGADIYKAHCSPCHGTKGAGDTMLGRNLNLRPLGSDEVQKQSDDELFTIISKGRNRMPAFNRRLTKDQMGDLVKYIRSLKK
jgi:cytochrome c5